VFSDSASVVHPATNRFVLLSYGTSCTYCQLVLTLWRRNYFFNFNTTRAQNVNNTETK